jgi:hypothetical protein
MSITHARIREHMPCAVTCASSCNCERRTVRGSRAQLLWPIASFKRYKVMAKALYGKYQFDSRIQAPWYMPRHACSNAVQLHQWVPGNSIFTSQLTILIQPQGNIALHNSVMLRTSSTVPDHTRHSGLLGTGCMSALGLVFSFKGLR